MKYIRKGTEPEALRAWRLSQKASPQNLVYEAISGNALDEVRDALLEEQGYICAYTMMRIASRDGGHIEHVVAQSKSRGTEWSIRFDNMVYCYPGKDAPRCEFGAHKKDGRELSPNEFVSPFRLSCEKRFLFERNGAIMSARKTDEAARNTIAILNLDCKVLQKARKAAIDSLPFCKVSRKRLTAREAKKLAAKLLERDADGKFRAFAVALHQVTAKYAERQAAKEAAISAR